MWHSDDTVEAIASVETYLLDLQNRLCRLLEQEDGSAHFQEEIWIHPSGGGGITRVLAEGEKIEKAGVNFSHIHGSRLPEAALGAHRSHLANASFQALGVSVVVHPRNPYVPTTHMNVRFFTAENAEGKTEWWFGGGFDLTPYYGFVEDCQHWHQMALDACEPFGETVYPQFKKACDAYFFLKNRNEPRGIGGIFFDNLNQWEFARCFDFMKSVGEHFMLAYQPIFATRKNHPFGNRERDFQLYRRGRYVEFNLLYDRGTLFGLQSNGRTESILMSLPPLVSWRYHWSPEKDSPEAKLYDTFLQPRDWI